MIPVIDNKGEKVVGVFRSPTGALVNRNKEELIKYNREKKLQDDMANMLARIVALEEIIGKLNGIHHI